MIARACKSVYWPGIRKSLTSFQTNCRVCSEISPSQPREPLQLTPLSKRPFEIICADLFQLNNKFYLIVVDRFSGFLHIYYSRVSPSHKFLEKNLRDIFVRYGRPDQLDTDNGPQFQSAAFLEFLKGWGVTHRTSSPYYAQSNGRAELGVKTAKRLLRDNMSSDGSLDNDRVARAVLQYHNTPLQDSPMSPAELLFGRELADFLPVNPKSYQLHPYWERQIQRNNKQRTMRHKRLIDRYNVGTRELKPLSIGQLVIIQNPITKRWDRFGTVLKAMPHRKYQLKLHDTGNVTYRNRRFLKPKKGLSHCQNDRFSTSFVPLKQNGTTVPQRVVGDSTLPIPSSSLEEQQQQSSSSPEEEQQSSSSPVEEQQSSSSPEEEHQSSPSLEEQNS